MSGRIIVVADDYGLSPGVSQAIRLLAAAKRISATSAIVTRPAWRTDAAALTALRDTIATGLHVNLTLGAPLSGVSALAPAGTLPSRGHLIAKALTGRLDRTAVRSEIAAQLDAFSGAIGAPPDFIDGHEHMHVLPGVRQTLFALLAERYPRRTILVRDPTPTDGARSLKARVLKGLARRMQRDCRMAGLICNDRFGGVTDFAATTAAVARDFDAAATIGGWRPIVMCHPGFVDSELQRLDAVTARRQIEFDQLMTPSSALAANAWRVMRAADGAVIWPRDTPVGLT